MSARPLLELDDVARAFGGLRAVDGLSASIDGGTILGLIGPNGSGKTTALNLISGALRPSSGSIRLDGRDIAGWAPNRVARAGIARTFQLVRCLPSLTAAENVMAGLAFGANPLWGTPARERADELLASVGLDGRGRAFPGEMTYIDQKRVELARALGSSPRVLLLDEWLAGLNPTELETGVALIRALRGDGRAIILVEHVMAAIRSLCDRCIVLNAGAKIAEGTPDDVLADPEVVRAYLGEPDA